MFQNRTKRFQENISILNMLHYKTEYTFQNLTKSRFINKHQDVLRF